MQPVLHVLGCGRAAATLARRMIEAGVVRPGQVANRSLASAREATEWMGRGRPAERIVPGGDDDWLMLGVPDSALADAAASMAGQPFGLAFHLSGAEPASVLGSLGKVRASVHPVFPFADRDTALERFPGSYAVGEGDPAALDLLLPAFEAIGARVLRFVARDKRLYHAATIAASNFLCTLDQLALDLASTGGLERDQALALIVALQRAALDSIGENGPTRALTGPIERGDVETIRRLVDHVERAGRDPASPIAGSLPVFRELGRATVRIAERRHPDRSATWTKLDRLFGGEG